MRYARTRIEKYYNVVVAEDLYMLYNCHNIMQLPQMQRAVLNTSSEKFLQNEEYAKDASVCASVLTGQKGVYTRAKKSIAAFSLREGDVLGHKTTLRGVRMYTLFDKITTHLLSRNESMFEEAFAKDQSLPTYADLVDRNLLHATDVVLDNDPFDSSLSMQRISSTVAEREGHQEKHKLKRRDEGASKVKTFKLQNTTNSFLNVFFVEARCLDDLEAGLTRSTRSHKRSCLNYGIKNATLLPEGEKLLETLHSPVTSFDVSISLSAHNLSWCRKDQEKTSYAKQSLFVFMPLPPLVSERHSTVYDVESRVVQKQKDLLFLSAFQWQT